MTFISTVLTSEGIILSADSKELVQGGQLLWSDFAEMLESKDISEDDAKESFSPIEIKEKFRSTAQVRPRIKSHDGAKKIFNIDSHCAILVSGKADLGGKDFPVIIQEIQSKIKSSKSNAFQSILSICSEVIQTLLIQEDAEDKYECKYLFCGFDREHNKFKIYTLQFCDQMATDDEGNFKKASDGKIIRNKVWKVDESSSLLNMSGWIKYIGELERLNHSNLKINLLEGLNLAKSIMELVVTIENISHKIPGIGGKIYFAAITRDGFSWVNTETDVMNLMK